MNYRTLLLVVIVASLAGYSAYVMRNSPAGVGAEPDRSAIRQMVFDAVVDQIEAESQGAEKEPDILAAPRYVGGASAGSFASQPPSAPDGYSFVVVHGEMAKGRIQPGVGSELDQVGTEHSWLGGPESINALIDQSIAARRDWTFGWIRLARDGNLRDLGESLQGLGGGVVGAAGNLIRVRLPGDEARLRTILALPEVDKLGAVPKGVKVAAEFVNQMLSRPPAEPVPVFVTLMTGDPAGRWRRVLEDMGAVVGHFYPDIRVYTANVAYDSLAAIAELDFVLAIEPVGVVEAAHDTAVPAMGADALRVYGGSPGLFSGNGGASVPVGVMDTGLNVNHLDIASNRGSICGANFVFSFPGKEYQDLWWDEHGHGTHVTGTIAGNGYVEPRFAGMAPAVSHIRFAKVLTHRGTGTSAGVLSGMDFLSRPSSCADAGWSDARVKPLIVNMSLSASSNVFEGRGAAERKLDSIVWSHRQLYVVAQSNSGNRAFSNYGTAKNSLAVGAARDSGHIAAFSSHGPTADGRLAPQVVATGVELNSARGGGSRGQYNNFSGTSMASPSVAGVAALLMDAVPAHREQPALTRARLMASAIKPDAWLDDPARFPANNANGPGSLQAQYGMGKVSAHTSILNRDQADGWISESAISELQDGEYAWHDIVVPEGASRLDLVLTWDEPPTDTIANAVLNDLDLWLDRGGDCGPGACGEYSSTSRRDNVEWVIVKNPAPGTWRVKALARRIYTVAPRAALAWTVIRGDATPTLGIEVDRTTIGSRDDELTLTVTTDAYVAAGTRLHVDCRQATGSCQLLGIESMSAVRQDGITRELNGITQGLDGLSIVLGEIAAGESQQVKLQISADESRRLYFTVSAWNALSAAASVWVSGSDGVDQADVPVARPPDNASFADAMVLGGSDGSRDLDLLLAAVEPGEPESPGSPDRPENSVWYLWEAPRDGLTRFGVSQSSGIIDFDNVGVDVLQGDHLGALDRVVSRGFGAEFFAYAGQTYRIRVSSSRRAVPRIIRWFQGPRPANDDFLFGTLLEGAEGSVPGNNQGATLESGELSGGLAATAWYRWTAPNDGAWRFSVNGGILRVLVHTGDLVSDLRLIAYQESREAVFRAGAGQEYRIAVAAPSAFDSGENFDLSWQETEREIGNDDFQGAEELQSLASSSYMVSSIGNTVEPGEPPATGIRTRWWVWTAPEDGQYTWRLQYAAHNSRDVILDFGYTERRMVVFSGTRLDDLQQVGTTGPDPTSIEISFDAVKGQRYWISIGLPTGGYGMFLFPRAFLDDVLRWGPTPENDALADAVELIGASGRVAGTNRFATTERGERAGNLGHSSLWWTFEASAPGWYRFQVDESDASLTLAVYRSSSDALGTLERVVTSRHGNINPDLVEVIFQAEAGVRYQIRLGTHGLAEGGDFTLRWSRIDRNEVPPRLEYIGNLADGDEDSRGNSIQLGELGSLAFNSRGTTLFAASTGRLQVFERNPETGRLALMQSLGDNIFTRQLLWDPHRAKLYATNCGPWRSFEFADTEHTQLTDLGFFEVRGGNYCHDGLFMDSSGSFIYGFSRIDQRLEVFTFGVSGGDRSMYLQAMQAVDIDGQITGALISNDGNYVYTTQADPGSLLVFNRDADTGELDQAGEVTSSLSLSTMAISDDNRYMFTIGESFGSVYTMLFQLDPDPTRLKLIDELSEISSNHDYFRSDNCSLASARNGVSAADFFCNGFAFSVHWRMGSSELVMTDIVAEVDYFNNPVPDFGDTISRVASPDGKHVYLATENSGIVIFERIGNAIVDVDSQGTANYASLSLLDVSPGAISFGPLSSGDCIGMSDMALDGIRYTIKSSKWQRSAGVNVDWADIDGTQKTGEVCAHTPSGPGQYRLVAEIAINGEVGSYASGM